MDCDGKISQCLKLCCGISIVIIVLPCAGNRLVLWPGGLGFPELLEQVYFDSCPVLFPFSSWECSPAGLWTPVSSVFSAVIVCHFHGPGEQRSLSLLGLYIFLLLPYWSSPCIALHSGPASPCLAFPRPQLSWNELVIILRDSCVGWS